MSAIHLLKRHLNHAIGGSILIAFLLRGVPVGAVADAATAQAGEHLAHRTGVTASAPDKQRHDWAVRWVLLKYSNGDLGKDPKAAWQEIERLVHRAAKAGYNGIVFADRNEYWYQGKDSAFWQKKLGDLRQLTRTLGMQLLVACVPAKTGGTAEMSESFPVKDAPLVVRGGFLVPVNTAVIRNGSFEKFEGHTPTYFTLPEAGKHALIDETQAHDGRTSIRVRNFEEVAGRNAMPVQTVAVKPFHQYRVSFWLKTSEDFKSTIRVMALVPGDGGKDRDLCRQQPSISNRTPRDEWIKLQATFNSWDNSEVKLLVGPINWSQSKRGKGTQGTYWLDDIQIEDVPFLNVNRRAELPNKLVGANGQVYIEGKDYARIVDPSVGQGWQPRYGIKQEHPAIAILPGSALRETHRVSYTGYHIGLEGPFYTPMPSLTSDLVFDMYADQVRLLRRVADPDGYLNWFDEMRVGGWEPKALEYATCGELLNAALKRSHDLIMREGGGKPHHSWHDMLTPTHNAHDNYYLLRNTADGAGKDLPKDLRIWVWGGGQRGAEHLAFFAKQGLHQILCTYYDTPDIEKQYQQWMQELDKAGAEVDGVVYSTWGKGRPDGFKNLEAFAKVWWGGGRK